jgi:hypothetical protein
MSIETLQQAIERAARFSPYATGLPSQQTDKTQGTMGGIQSLQRASEPNFQIKLDALEKSFMRPLARIYLKMIANLMGKNDIRYGLLKDQQPQWVAATKGILTGKATLQDMLIVGMISQDEFELTARILTLENKNPKKHIIFDVDWIVDVRLDNQSEIDKQQKTQQKMGWINWSQQLGVQFSPERTATEIGRESGIENPEELYLTDEEKQQLAQQQQATMAQQGQMQQEQQQGQLQHKQTFNDMKLQSEQQKMGLEAQKGQMGLAIKQAQAEQMLNHQKMRNKILSKMKASK